MELRQAGKDEVQGDVQFAQTANTGATFSKLELRVVTEVEKSLYKILLGLWCAVRKCPEFGPEILEYITPISLGSEQKYFEPMKLPTVPDNYDHTYSVMVFIFQWAIDCEK